MPLRIKTKSSAAVKYAVKAYRKEQKAKKPPVAEKPEIQVVKIRRQPVKKAWERIKDYFR